MIFNIALVLLLLTPITAFSTSSVIPTLTDIQAAHVLDDMTTSIHTILGTDSDATRQFNIEKLAGIIENITGYKEDISVSMAGNGLNIRIDPDPDGTSTSTSNGDSSSARLVQDPCSNQPGSARMTFPYENRTDCEVEQWIECIENSGTVRWDQLHCDDLKKLFEDPSVPLTPPHSNNTKPPVAGAVLTPTPTPTPTPTDRCYAGFAYMIPNYDEVCGTGEDLREDEDEQPPVPLPLYGEGEGEGEQPPVEDQDQGDNSGEEQEEEEGSSDDSGEEEEPTQPQPQFGE